MASTERIGPFPRGMDNRRPDFQLALGREDGGGYLLRDAFNVDVTPRGATKSREGYARIRVGTDCHSGWSPLDGSFSLYCDDGTIYRLDATSDGSMQRTNVAAGFGSLLPVRYAQVNEAVYFTDGVRVGSYHPIAGPTQAWATAQAVLINDQWLEPMPAGSCIAYQGARLLVAVGSVLVYSEPFLPHLRDPARGYEMFPAPITCVAAVEGGVLVLADKTYFVQGGFPAQSVRAVLQYGGPSQQATYSKDGSAHWVSTRGICSCDKSGDLQNLQEKHVAMRTEGSAATLYRETDGSESIVAALSKTSSTAAGVGSYAEARIVRKPL